MYKNGIIFNCQSIVILRSKVRTLLRWCGQFYVSYMQHFFTNKAIKNYKNWLRLAKVIVKCKLPRFCGPLCRSVGLHQSLLLSDLSRYRYSVYCCRTQSVGAAFALTLRPSVCLSVRVSVTLMYCAQTTESIIMRPSLDCSPAILVFSHQIWTRWLEGISLMASNGRGVSKKPEN